MPPALHGARPSQAALEPSLKKGRRPACSNFWSAVSSWPAAAARECNLARCIPVRSSQAWVSGGPGAGHKCASSAWRVPPLTATGAAEQGGGRR